MSDGEESTRSKAGYIVLALFVLVPAMVLSGFFGELVDALPFLGWLGIAAAGGLVGGGLLAEDAPVLGAVAGLVSGALTPFAVAKYVDFRLAVSETFLTLEFVVPALIACIPGFLIYFGGRRLIGGGSEG